MTQLQYMMQELQGPEKRTMDAFKSGSLVTPQDYADAFDRLYERSDRSAVDRRKQYALEVFKASGTDAFGTLPKNAQTAFNYFKGKGFDDAQAAGIVGNLMVESYSNIDPQAFNPSENSYGIAQFRGSRLKGLLDFAGQNKEDNAMNGTQLGMPLQAQMTGQSDQRGGIRGLLDYATEKDEKTGLSRFQKFAAALDPLIMPQMRAGGAIRAAGAQRVQSARVNKTIEWLKKNGYPEIAAAVEANPQTAANAMSAILAQRTKKAEQFRVATPEEAAKYGAEAGQFDSAGRFYPTQKIEKTQTLTSSEQSKAQNALLAYQSITPTINEYKRLVDEGGLGLIPGTQQDVLKQTQTNLMLQMKELYNLGVLNGPDLDLMEKMVYDVTSPRNYATSVIGGQDPKQRFKTNLENLERQLELLARPKVMALQNVFNIGQQNAGGSGDGFSVTGKVGNP